MINVYGGKNEPNLGHFESFLTLFDQYSEIRENSRFLPKNSKKTAFFTKNLINFIKIS